MKNKIVICLLSLALWPNFVFGAVETAPALKDVFIKYQQQGWQTYEFFVLTNLPSQEELSYVWRVNQQETFPTEKLRYFFPLGTHEIAVSVTDEFGNTRSDLVQLDIRFWSLRNNWLWLLLYLILILLIFYYWAAKIIYLLNKRRVSRQARYFLDLLDEHGWIDQLIKLHAKRK